MNIKKTIQRIRDIEPFRSDRSDTVIFESEDEKTKTNPNFTKHYFKKISIFGIRISHIKFTQKNTVDNKDIQKSKIGFKS